MTDHIDTSPEAVERLADNLRGMGYVYCDLADFTLRALSADRDRMAADNAALREALAVAKREAALASAQFDRLLTLTNKIDDDLQESRGYATALEHELKARAALAIHPRKTDTNGV